MSYILEALKKSNAERERGARCPTCMRSRSRSQAVTKTMPPAGQAKLWLGLAAGAVIVLAAVLGWRFTAPRGPTLARDCTRTRTRTRTRTAPPRPAPPPRCWRRRQLRPRRLHRRLLPSPSQPRPRLSRRRQPQRRAHRPSCPQPRKPHPQQRRRWWRHRSNRKKARAARAPQTPDAVAGSRRHGEEARGAGSPQHCSAARARGLARRTARRSAAPGAGHGDRRLGLLAATGEPHAHRQWAGPARRRPCSRPNCNSSRSGPRRPCSRSAGSVSKCRLRSAPGSAACRQSLVSRPVRLTARTRRRSKRPRPAPAR